MSEQYDYEVPFQRRIVAAAWKDGKLLRDREVYDPGHLTDEVLAGVLRALQGLQDATGNVPDLPAVVEAVRDQVAPGRKWGEYAKEAKLVWSKVKDGNLEHYASEAVAFARRRAVARAIEEAHELVRAGELDSIESLVRRALRTGGTGSRAVDHFATSADRYRTYAEGVERDRLTRVTTGLGPFDRATRGGIAPGELGCILGLTGTGKSHYLVNTGAAAVLSGKNVLHVSCENSLAVTQTRYDCRLLGFPRELMCKKPRTFREKFEALNQALKSKLMVEAYPSNTLTTSKLEVLIESIDPRPQLVLVDYAATLVSPSKAEELRHRLYATVEALRGIAGRTGTGIWTAAQASFEGMGSRLLGPQHSSECRTLNQILDYGASINVDISKPAHCTIFVYKLRDGEDGFEIPCEKDWKTSRITAIEEAK